MEGAVDVRPVEHRRWAHGAAVFAGVLESAIRLSYSLHPPVIAELDGLFQSKWLQNGAQVIDVVELTNGEWRHRCPQSRAQLHETPSRQPLQGLTQGGSADPVTVGQLRCTQAPARLEGAGHNVDPNRLFDLGGQRRSTDPVRWIGGGLFNYLNHALPNVVRSIICSVSYHSFRTAPPLEYGEESADYAHS